MFEDSLAITLSSHFCKLHKVCIACLYATPFILQTVGLFTTKWIINDTCDSVGLFYSCCGGPDNNTCRPSQIENGLGTTGRDLQISSFVMMLIGLLMFFVGIPCACGLFKISKPERDRLYDRTLHACCDILFGCLIIFLGVLLMLISGILNICGCIVVATKFSSAQLGYSFYLCVIAGCIFILMSIISCLAFCCDRNGYKNLTGKTPQLSKTTNHQEIIHHLSYNFVCDSKYPEKNL